MDCSSLPNPPSLPLHLPPYILVRCKRLQRTFLSTGQFAAVAQDAIKQAEASGIPAVRSLTLLIGLAAVQEWWASEERRNRYGDLDWRAKLVKHTEEEKRLKELRGEQTSREADKLQTLLMIGYIGVKERNNMEKEIIIRNKDWYPLATALNFIVKEKKRPKSEELYTAFDPNSVDKEHEKERVRGRLNRLLAPVLPNKKDPKNRPGHKAYSRNAICLAGVRCFQSASVPIMRGHRQIHKNRLSRLIRLKPNRGVR